MAKVANAENVEAAMRPTDYRGAFKRLQTIDAKVTKQRMLAKEVNDVYEGCVVKHSVDKTACKIFRSLMKLSVEDRTRTFRDLNGLLDVAGVEEEAKDLVDQSENKAVSQRLSGKVVPLRGVPVGNAQAGDAVGDDEDELNDDLIPNPDDNLLDSNEDDQKADAEDGFTPIADADLADAGEAPFTGDNSDLVNG